MVYIPDRWVNSNDEILPWSSDIALFVYTTTHNNVPNDIPLSMKCIETVSTMVASYPAEVEESQQYVQIDARWADAGHSTFFPPLGLYITEVQFTGGQSGGPALSLHEMIGPIFDTTVQVSGNYFGVTVGANAHNRIIAPTCLTENMEYLYMIRDYIQHKLFDTI